MCGWLSLFTVSRERRRKSIPNFINKHFKRCYFKNRKKLGCPKAISYYIRTNKSLRNLVIRLVKNHNKNFRSIERVLLDLFFKEQHSGEKFEF
jgi:hypothetical protein